MNKFNFKNVFTLAGILIFMLSSCDKEEFFWNRKLNSFSGEFLLKTIHVEVYEEDSLIDRTQGVYEENSKMIFYSTQNEATQEYYGTLMTYNNSQLTVLGFTYKNDGERLILKSTLPEFNGPFDFSINGFDCVLTRFNYKIENGKEYVEKRIYTLDKVPLSR